MATFKTEGTCASHIHFDIEDGKVVALQFQGGCPGNAIGLSSIAKGMDIDELIEKVRGIKCGNKHTSCPDQLAMALTEWKNEQK